MAAEYVYCSLTSQKVLLLRQTVKKDGLLRQPIACYEIAKRTYDFVDIRGKSYDKYDPCYAVPRR